MVPPKWRQVDAPGQAAPGPVSAWLSPGARWACPEALLPCAGCSAGLERGRALLGLPAEEGSAGAVAEEAGQAAGPRRAGPGNGLPLLPGSWPSAGHFGSAWAVFGADTWGQFCPETGEHWIRSLVVSLETLLKSRWLT